MKTLSIDQNGALTLPLQVRRPLADAPLSVVSHSQKHLFLAKESSGQPVIFAGQLGDFSVADLISFFNMFRRQGLLHFDLPGGSKKLWFAAGEIVFATTTFPEEDLGEMLIASGKVDVDALASCRKEVTSDRSIGAVLLEKALVTQQDIWTAVRQQAEEIVYNLFAETSGSFYYHDAVLEGAETVRLSMNTQNLLMEGLRRLDERTHFMRRIGSLDAYVIPQEKDPSLLSDELGAMYGLTQGKAMVVRDLVRQSGAGDFDGLRQVFQLVEKKYVAIEQPKEMSIEGELAILLDIFNALLSQLYAHIAPVKPSFRDDVSAFLRDIPQPYRFVLRGSILNDDGSLSDAEVVANLEGLSAQDQKTLLADALSELLYMECIVAQQLLEEEIGNGLIQQVQQVSRRVANLVGSSV